MPFFFYKYDFQSKQKPKTYSFQNLMPYPSKINTKEKGKTYYILLPVLYTVIMFIGEFKIFQKRN